MKVNKEFLDKVEDSIISLHQIHANTPWSDGDIRKDTLALVLSNLITFYHDLNYVNLLEDHEGGFSYLRTKSPHPQSGFFNDSIVNNLIQKVIRNVVIDVWSVIEPFIDKMYEGVVPTSKQEKHQLEDYNKFLKAFDINDSESKILLKKMSRKKPSIKTKIDSIFKAAGLRNDEARKDINFLEVLYLLRNGQHSNYVWKGKEFEYKFAYGVIVFMPGKPIEEGYFAVSDKNYLAALYSRYHFLEKAYSVIQNLSIHFAPEKIDSYPITE